MMGANMEATLLGAYAVAQAHGFQFKLMKIPDSVELGADPFGFDPEIMKVLFEKGRALGRSPSSWVAAPSAGQNASPWLIKVLSELGRQR
jgi:hypothetical protein